MSFFESSRNVSLQGSVLHAQCTGPDGQFHDSSIDTNNLLGNNNGSFVPGSGWFQSAETSQLNGRILQAGLLAGNGQVVGAEFNLDE
jgi:hypothetical protein